MNNIRSGIFSIIWLSQCPAGVPTSSSRGHSMQNLYHCLTNSISQYIPCLGTDFIHSWIQSGGRFKTHTHTHHIAKSCFTASEHYWTFHSVIFDLLFDLGLFLFIVIACCLAWPSHVLDYSSALPWILLFAGVGPCLLGLRSVLIKACIWISVVTLSFVTEDLAHHRSSSFTINHVSWGSSHAPPSRWAAHWRLCG